MNEKYFCVHLKNRRKHNQHFKLLLFTLNLHFVTSNQIPPYRKNYICPSKNSICLVFLLLQMETRLKQPKYTTSFLLLMKKNDPQTFSGSSKNSHCTKNEETLNGKFHFLCSAISPVCMLLVLLLF